VMWEGLGVLLLAMVVRVFRLERLGGMGNSINEFRARTADADVRISATSYIEAKGTGGCIDAQTGGSGGSERNPAQAC
jgi:hypothetical protein